MVEFKVAFVLRLVDDFTGKVITSEKFLFHVEDRIVRPVEKEEGLFVFLEPLPHRINLVIGSPDYHEAIVTVEREKLNPFEPVADVRLYGKAGRSHSYRAGLVCGRIEHKGHSLPAVVYALKSQSSGLVFREMCQIDSETIIRFNGFTKEQLVGKVFALDAGKKTELFIILQKRGINEYIVEGNLTGKHKAGEPLTRAYRSFTDETGAYAILVDPGEEDQIKEVIVLQYNIRPS